MFHNFICSVNLLTSIRHFHPVSDLNSTTLFSSKVVYFSKKVNNAGILTFGDLASSPMDVYDKMMSINVRSVIFLTKLCLPHLEKTKGAIVNVSSVCGPRSYPGIVYYSMSKSAIDQLTRCAALELASKGIRVNAIA
uniref:Uncharacterized protein n=1 Tax=Romanomermis culicivorax TaxID=13658 RepID=A0A915JAG6_ROMCU